MELVASELRKGRSEEPPGAQEEFPPLSVSLAARIMLLLELELPSLKLEWEPVNERHFQFRLCTDTYRRRPRGCNRFLLRFTAADLIFIAWRQRCCEMCLKNPSADTKTTGQPVQLAFSVSRLQGCSETFAGRNTRDCWKYVFLETSAYTQPLAWLQLQLPEMLTLIFPCLEDGVFIVWGVLHLSNWAGQGWPSE